jgi:hypothetical protein
VNLNEAIDLLDVVSDFQFKISEEKPDFCIYDYESGGYALSVKAHLISEKYRTFLKEIAESRNLRIREADGVLTIQSY